jgi:glycosyltransferase involved in cell wall biosynthesis
MAAASVSVVIPAYNRSSEVTHALRSLVPEASLIHEILLIDDASHVAIDPPVPDELKGKVRIIRLEVNLGSSGARQVGIDLAEGQFLAFLDSDDAWLPGKLAAQLPFLDHDDPLLAIATGWQVLDLDRGTMATRFPVEANQPLLFASGCWFCPGSTVIIPRAAFAMVGPLDRSLRRLEDFDWFLRFGLAGGRLAVAPIVGALIRRTAKSNRVIVNEAADIIIARFRQLLVGQPKEYAALCAWIDVERAFANWTQSRRLAALALMARSQFRHPRPGIQLRRWWRTEPPVLTQAQAQTLLGLDGTAAERVHG